MDKVDTASISKGCFVVLGNSKNVSPRPCEYLNNNGIKCNARSESAQELWNEITDHVKSLNDKLQENIFENLVSYVGEAFISSERKSSGIPTAILSTGVNMPDHAAMFQQLKLKMENSIPSSVVILQSGMCPNMKTLMRNICDQLLINMKHMIGDHDTTHDEYSFTRNKSTAVSISMIKEWYLQICQQRYLQKSPRKKLKLTSDMSEIPPVVIMFQDLEGFPPKLLQDFILMTSCHVPSFPMVLVLGVATTWCDVSKRLFPQSVIVHLSVKTFSAPTASSHSALIIDEVLLSWNHPFKLSGKCLQLLLDVFLCHDFSITNFLHILKFCVLEHFYEKSASILCTCHLPKAVQMVSKFSETELKEMKQLASVQRYASQCDEQFQSVKKDSTFRNLLKSFLKDLHTYHQTYFPVLRCLHELTSSLPQYPMGKQLREVYIACSRNELPEYPGYREAFTFLKVSSRDQLIDRLRACVEHLDLTEQSQTNEDLSIFSACQKIHSIIEEFTKMGENPSSQNDDKDDVDDDDEIEELERVKYAYQLQERLRNRCKIKRKKKMSKFEKLREEILNYLKMFFGHHLRRVQSLPVYEASYFDSSSEVKQHLVAAPRSVIQTALADPFKYLQVPSLESVATGVIPNNAPDICVAYKLHNECGTLINLFDWMQAFHTIVTSSDDVDDDVEVEIDDVTQARFIRAVSELQLLGFIRPTKRKTDHVQRLTWSHI